MKVVDLMVSRAGASTISEITALGIPTIFIPSPHVTDNHQFKNAMGLVKEQAAVLLEEKNLKEDILVKEIDSLFGNPMKLESMQKKLEKLALTDSATKIVKELKQLIDGDNYEKNERVR